jgi:hypothetical protein
LIEQNDFRFLDIIYIAEKKVRIEEITNCGKRKSVCKRYYLENEGKYCDK